ncbi:phosphate ABC transporter permease PstA [Jatrophihabitans sp.]|uniref:phosphate ABC transporter permease PstA n=1 Tax=Jatrophihabitans sp. TaxID=1932789 RepID=UPI0030C66025|nr:phosphate transporter permease [Jatrophihabitans sp.]
MTLLDDRPAAPGGPPPDGPPPAAAPPEVSDDARPIRSRSRDDKLNLVGAGVASLALVWVIYERLLPFSGKFGFVVLWYVVFLVLYTVLTAVNNPLPVVTDRLASSVMIAGPLIVLVALVSMVLFTFIKGWAAYTHVNFYTHDMGGVQPTAALRHGGAEHALVGTLIEVGIATAIALPLGVGAAVYMTEVGGRLSRVVQTIVEAMTALPSIVAGLFIYTVLLKDLHFQASGFAASLALTVMGLPIMARASVVVLRVVPGGLREASLALGAGRWQTVWRVVLPTARPGLATALILGIARMVGETSPVLLTSGASTFFNDNPVKNPMNSLPLYIYTAVRSGEVGNNVTRGFGAAAMLLVVVLILFLTARFVAREKKVR